MKIKNHLLTLFILLLSGFLNPSFEMDTNIPETIEPALTSTVPSFKMDIWPLMQQKCAVEECHGGKEPVKFTGYDSVKEKSKRIKKRVGNIMLPMPPNNSEIQLSKEETSLIKNWIAAGAPNN